MVNVHRYSTLETDLTHTVLEWWYEDLHDRQPVISPALRTLTRAIRCAVWRLRRVIIVLFFIIGQDTAQIGQQGRLRKFVDGFCSFFFVKGTEERVLARRTEPLSLKFIA